MEPGAGRYLLYASQVYALPILRPLQRAIRERGGRAAWFFDGPGASYLREDEELVRTIRGVRDFRPLAVFVPGNRVPDFFPGVKVEVFHGFSVGKRSERRGHFRVRGLFDLYCTQGSTTTSHFRNLAQRHGHFHVVETGWPKTDPLFRPASAAWRRWRAGWPAERPLVLFASTFTRSLSAAPHLLGTIRDLAARGRWNWLVTLHPKMAPGTVRGYRALQGPHLRFAEPDDVVPLYRAADVIVSDTSSVVYEFLLLHKPAVTFRNAEPGPHLINVSDPDRLEAAIERALTRPRELMRSIVSFAEAIHPYRDGRSSERVLEATHDFADHVAGRLARKPVNLWRKVQLRRRLGYYHWQ
jgi:CDP-glycerol glycerophosphotransferase (TagB/SpsB family)